MQPPGDLVMRLEWEMDSPLPGDDLAELARRDTNRLDDLWHGLSMRFDAVHKTPFDYPRQRELSHWRLPNL
jgi:hypothetical protein